MWPISWALQHMDMGLATLDTAITKVYRKMLKCGDIRIIFGAVYPWHVLLFWYALCDNISGTLHSMDIGLALLDTADKNVLKCPWMSTVFHGSWCAWAYSGFVLPKFMHISLLYWTVSPFEINHSSVLFPMNELTHLCLCQHCTLVVCTQLWHHCYPSNYLHTLFPTVHWCRSPPCLHSPEVHQPNEVFH